MKAVGVRGVCHALIIPPMRPPRKGAQEDVLFDLKPPQSPPKTRCFNPQCWHLMIKDLALKPPAGGIRALRSIDWVQDHFRHDRAQFGDIDIVGDDHFRFGVDQDVGEFDRVVRRAEIGDVVAHEQRVSDDVDVSGHDHHFLCIG